MLASPETNVTIDNDEQGVCMADTGNVAMGEAVVDKEPGVIDEDTDSDDIPELVQAPLADTLSPRTAAMVLEAAGPGDGQILLDNAKDLAATLRFLHQRLHASLMRADDAEHRANEPKIELKNSRKTQRTSPHKDAAAVRSSSHQRRHHGPGLPRGIRREPRASRWLLHP
jgi:hypothetical protein